MEIEFSAVCALLGAVVGASGVAITTWITQRQETKRRIIATLIESGMKEWSKHFDVLIHSPGYAITPPWVYIMGVSQYAKTLEKLPKLTDDELKEVMADTFKRQMFISAECRRLDKEWRSSKVSNTDNCEQRERSRH